MTQIKKVKTSEGVQFYPQTHTKAVIDDNGYTVESRMQAVQDVVNQAQMQIGSVPNDLAPTKDSTNWVTSGGVYKAMQVVRSELTEVAGSVLKKINTIDISLSTTGKQKNNFSNTRIGFVEGRYYRIRSYVNTVQNIDIAFYLREQTDQTPLWENAGVNIPAGSLVSEPYLYLCINDNAQYLSMYRDVAGTANYKVRIEELEYVEMASEEELKGASFVDVDPIIAQGGADQNLEWDATNRLRTQFIRTYGSFMCTIGDGYRYIVQYYDDNKVFVKSALPSFWLYEEWNDSWDGYIKISISKIDNSDLTLSDAHGLKVLRAVSNDYRLLREISTLEFGTIDAGFDMVNSKSCRTPLSHPIIIANGETIECAFKLAVNNNAYGGYYKYKNGQFIEGNGTAINLNDGSVVTITCDGTFNEVRFRVLGANTWTEELASSSYVVVERNAEKTIRQSVEQVQELVDNNFYYNGEGITLGKKKFQQKRILQFVSQVNNVQSADCWNDYLVIGSTDGNLRVYDFNDGTYLGVATIPVTAHCNNLMFAKELHSGNSQFPYLYISQWDSPSNLFVFDLIQDGGTFELNLVQTYDATSLDRSLFGYRCDFYVDWINGYIYSAGYPTDVDDAISYLFCKFELADVSAGNIVWTNDDILDNWRIDDGYKYRQGGLFDDGKIYSVAGIFDYQNAHNWMFAVDVNLHKKVTTLDLAQFTGPDEEPEALFVYNGILYFLTHTSSGYIRIHRLSF